MIKEQPPSKMVSTIGRGECMRDTLAPCYWLPLCLAEPLLLVAAGHGWGDGGRERALCTVTLDIRKQFVAFHILRCAEAGNSGLRFA